MALVTQYFPPEVYPQTLWLAQAMRGNGFDVHVCTSVPNYPTGEVMAGYSAHHGCNESVDGFRVTRSPVYPSHDGSAVGRIANYLSFAAATTWSSRAVLRTADLALVWATPATVGAPALAARLRYGRPYVLYVQDLWPDSVFATQFLTGGAVHSVAERGLTGYLRALYAHASHIVAISPGMARTLMEREVPEARVSVVYNWVDEQVMRPVEPNGRLRSVIGVGAEAFLLVFAGNQGAAQALTAWVDAMATLADLPDTHLVLLGTGSERASLEKRVREARLATVHFVDPVPVTEVSSMVADADVSVLSLADEALFRITVPSKTQASLAQGKPIITSAPGETSDLIKSAGAGWVARPTDPGSIAGAIRAARDAGRDEARRRGSAGRAFYQQNMSQAVGSSRLSSIVRDAIRGSGRRP